MTLTSVSITLTSMSVTSNTVNDFDLCVSDLDLFVSEIKLSVNDFITVNECDYFSWTEVSGFSLIFLSLKKKKLSTSTSLALYTVLALYKVFLQHFLSISLQVLALNLCLWHWLNIAHLRYQCLVANHFNFEFDRFKNKI